MNREGHIWGRVCTYENIAQAHRNARKDKHYYREVQAIDENPRPYLEEIQRMLVDKTYKTSEYTVFQKFDTGKVRTIYKLPYFPDRIVHWAIMQQVQHLFMRVFTSNTHAAIPGRGIHSAMTQVKKYTESDPEGTRYCLKFDVRKFFPSVNHEILKHQLRRIIKCPDTLCILDGVVDSIDSTKEIPIGNYLSQFFANLYLAWFDHWVKETLHVRYYTRYMDDVVILSGDKDELWVWLNKIRNYLKAELWLDIKDNYAVFPISARAIDYTGYKNWGVDPDHRQSKVTLRKSTWKNMRRVMLDIAKYYEETGCITEHQYSQYNSYTGWCGWAVSGTIREKYVEPLRPAMKHYAELKKQSHGV